MLSPAWYVIYINELLKKLTRIKKRSSIPDVHIACPTQADDIAVISPSARNMQDMLLMCENCTSKWRFTFSSSKKRSNNKLKPDASFSLYNKQLPTTTSIMHVGIKMDANFDHLGKDRRNL